MNMKHFLGRLFMAYTFLMAFIFLHCPFSFAYENEIKDISSTMFRDITDAGKKTIAVADFTDLQGNVTELGRFLAEEFSVALAGAGKGFEVIDRTHLKSIIAEHKLSLKGIIDPKTARKLGKIAGVGALITGTITPFGDSVRLSVKVLDIETAKMISATTGNIAKTKAIEELLDRGIEVGPASGRPVALPPARTSIGKAVEAGGFTFRPVKCTRSGGKVICLISFINNGDKNREVLIAAQRRRFFSRFYDNLGNQYPVKIQIGNQVSDYIRQTFISQLPLNVNFIAEEVHPDATHVTVTIATDLFKKLVVVRNIPITK